jgi:phosphatidylethanolamine/phosphatidyl-N-methylethanolamine N-methyltransferase
MSERVTGFPFNVLDNPMYVGGTMTFLGYALWHASPAGLLLACLLGLCYRVAIIFENSFTTFIYEEAAKKKAKGQ